MGYEVSFSYHERTDDGYNKEETKTLKKRVGSSHEEIPLEKLAGAIMAQLARRDIWVTGCEVFEFVKKPISFRETKGGIIINNKKFLLDQQDASNIVMQDLEPVLAPGQHPHELLRAPNSQNQPHNQPVNNGIPAARPLKWVMFVPELYQITEVKQKGLQLTPDKKYPVFGERPSPNGVNVVYKIKDDRDREIEVSDIYFVPGDTQLLADRELGFSRNPAMSEGGKLDWGGVIQNDDVPRLR